MADPKDERIKALEAEVAVLSAGLYEATLWLRHEKDSRISRKVEAWSTLVANADLAAKALLENASVVQVLPEALKQHHIRRIEHDEKKKTDRVECSCGTVKLPARMSTSEAVQTWVEHFLEQL